MRRNSTSNNSPFPDIGRHRHWMNHTPSTASSQARAYILNHFFDLDSETLALVVEFYGNEHGDGARKYFESTFNKWRTGNVQPRRETQDRILHCVPRFLSSEKQFEILSFYIPEYLSDTLLRSRVSRLKIEELPQAFKNAASRCVESEPNLDWFVEGVFSEEEIAAFVDVARYTILDQLHRSYAAVRFDLLTAPIHLAGIDALVNVHYHLDLLGGEVLLNGSIPTLPPIAFQMPSMPLLIVRHQQQYERLLINHEVDMLTNQNIQSSRNLVGQLDLATLRDAVASISKSDSMESQFEAHCAGGVFKGTISRKNLFALKAQLLGRITVALPSAVAMIAGVIVLVIDKDLCGFGFIVGFLSLGVILGLWGWVIEKHKEVNEYERRKAHGFTTVQS